MGIWDRITDRIQQWREYRAMSIIDDINGEPRGTTADDARDRRGQLDRPSYRHLEMPRMLPGENGKRHATCSDISITAHSGNERAGATTRVHHGREGRCH